MSGAKRELDEGGGGDESGGGGGAWIEVSLIVIILFVLSDFTWQVD